LEVYGRFGWLFSCYNLFFSYWALTTLTFSNSFRACAFNTMAYLPATRAHLRSSVAFYRFYRAARSAGGAQLPRAYERGEGGRCWSRRRGGSRFCVWRL